MGFTLVMPFLPLYLSELGVSDVGELAFWSGISLGVTPAMTALLAPVWGRVADRFGRKLMVERSLVSFILIMTAMAFVTRPWHILALRAVQGFFAGYGGIALAMAAESAPAGRLASAIGTVQTAQRLGPAIGPVVGGVLAHTMGLRRVFLVSAMFYVVGLVLVFWMYRERPRARDEAARAGERRISFGNVLAFEHFLLLMVVIFSIQFVDRSLGPILPLYVAHLGVPASRVPIVAGLVFSVIATSGAAGNNACARLLRRYPPHVLIGRCAGLAALALIALLAPVGTLTLLVAASLIGFATGTAITASYTTAGGVVPEGARAEGFGMLSSASLAAMAVSPMASGFIAGRQLTLVFVVDALLLATVAVLVWRIMEAGEVRPAMSSLETGSGPVSDQE
jgi:MFS transporter, DHA1 family, multidrug resistance protein